MVDGGYISSYGESLESPAGSINGCFYQLEVYCN